MTLYVNDPSDMDDEKDTDEDLESLGMSVREGDEDIEDDTGDTIVTSLDDVEEE